MIAFLSICYCGLIWLIFYKLKLAKFDLRAKVIAALVGVAGISALLITMNLCQPYSKDLRIYKPIVEILPRVTGRVIQVAVSPNVPLKKADLLFKIDPVPFKAEVDRLEAALVEAEFMVPQLKAALDSATETFKRRKAERKRAKIEYDRYVRLAKRSAAAQKAVVRWKTEYETSSAAVREATAQREQARLAYESRIHGEHTTVAQLKAALEKARWALSETAVYAPGNGFVTNMSLRPGQIASQMVSRPVVSFIYDQEAILIASFTQNALRHINQGDLVEVAFDNHPGKIFQGTVQDLIPATGQGQLPPSGTLKEFTTTEPRGRFPVRLKLNAEPSELDLPAGAAGVAAVYTDKAKPIRVVRKVIIRIFTWMNYLP
jgi:multidrug resistance efflux pump